MSHPTVPTPARGSAELSTIAKLSDDATELLAAAGGNPPPKEFIQSLLASELFPDAVGFLAHALPRREAVWWAWVCARKSAGPTPPPPIKAALDATERWIMQPTDDNRRQAMAFAEAADVGTPAGAAALSAFLSSGSLGPPETPPVPPGEFMTAKAVAGSVTLAAVTVEPEKAKVHFAEYVKLGLEVAERTKLWSA